MWQWLKRGDIEKAKVSLGYRLAETLSRQQQEIKSLRARHADELHLLEAKQVELETLDALIERFADEFPGTPQDEAAPEQEPTTEARDGALDQRVHADTTVPAVADLTLAEKLAVPYVAPSFRPLRRFAA